MRIRCYASLVKYNALTVLERYYGKMIVSPENKYDFSLCIDLETLSDDEKEKNDLIRSIGLLKRNMLAAPFEMAFMQQELLAKEQESAKETINKVGEVMEIPYREEEAIFIIPSFDRVTVIFSTIFREETDRIIGKVFLQVIPFLGDKNIKPNKLIRNLWMHAEDLLFRMHLKFYILIAIHL